MSALIRQRLHNQKLSSSKFQQPADVVRWLGGVQAQDFNAAKWALALRMRKATNDVVDEAFNRGEILRTHVLRPTWHFVAPEDIRWLLTLTAPRVNVRCGPNYRKFELDAKVFKKSNKALASALEGGKHLTRAELKTALNRAGVAADDPIRFVHILLRAELDAVVCSGPRRGKQFTHALLEERVPAAPARTHDEALAELTKRYFASHGPATLPDFVWWSGLTTDDARRGIAMIERHLEKSLEDETICWSLPSSTSSPAYSAHLLPAFDEYNVAYKNRELVFDTGAKMTNWNALGPTIIIDGRIVGTWKGTVDKKQVKIAASTARALTKRDELTVETAAMRYSAFLGAPLKFSISSRSRSL